MRNAVVAVVVVAVGCGSIPPETSGGGGGTHSASGGGSSAGGGSARAGGGGGGGGGRGSAGTGGGPPGGSFSTDLYTAGTRLKVRSLVGTDGSRMQSGLWDSQRNEPCNFALASDGKMRCLPTTDIAVAAVAVYFADPACKTTPAFPVQGCSSSQSLKYGLVYHATGTCGGFGASYSFSVHSVAASTSTTYYYLSGANCAQATLSSGYSLFTATEAIDPSNFVAATYVTE